MNEETTKILTGLGISLKVFENEGIPYLKKLNLPQEVLVSVRRAESRPRGRAQSKIKKKLIKDIQAVIEEENLPENTGFVIRINDSDWTIYARNFPKIKSLYNKLSPILNEFSDKNIPFKLMYSNKELKWSFND